MLAFSRCSGWQGFAAMRISENRKNILRFSSSPLEGTTKSQPSRIYQRPGHAGETETAVRYEGEQAGIKGKGSKETNRNTG